MLTQVPIEIVLVWVLREENKNVKEIWSILYVESWLGGDGKTKDWDCTEEQHRAVGISLVPDHWLSACIARYPCLKGSPSLTWLLLLILHLGCSSHPTSDVSQFLFPSWAWQPRHSFPRAAPIWAMDLCPIPIAQTPRASSLSWCQNCQESQKGRPGVCGEIDLREKRWGWRGQQSQISTSIRSLGFNGVGF